MDIFILMYMKVVVIFLIGTFSFRSIDRDDEEDSGLKR